MFSVSPSPRLCFVAKIASVLCLFIATLFLFNLSHFVIENFERKPACISTHEVANNTYEIDTTKYETLDEFEDKFKDELLPGGWYKPIECTATYKTAIIVPFLNEVEEVAIFLNNMHSFLMKQQIEYRIFLIKQNSNETFNRGMLFNIGFVEALKLNQWDCYIFHDVNFIPMDNRNLYKCLYQPHHMAVSDEYNFQLPYANYFGDVSAMKQQQFEAVNGFSNSFWHSDGEYDDMYNRIENAGYEILRYPIEYAHYKKFDALTQSNSIMSDAAELVNELHPTGLSTLEYKVIKRKDKLLCTCIWVEIKSEKQTFTKNQPKFESMPTMKSANETFFSG